MLGEYSPDDVTGLSAVEELARALHDKMEHLDPSDEGSNWDSLSDAEKQFYRSCVVRLSLERELWGDILR